MCVKESKEVEQRLLEEEEEEEEDDDEDKEEDNDEEEEENEKVTQQSSKSFYLKAVQPSLWNCISCKTHTHTHRHSILKKKTHCTTKLTLLNNESK